MSKEFILKTSKLFRKYVGTIIEKKTQKNNGSHIEQIYCFVSISLFCCLFQELRLMLFYN